MEPLGRGNGSFVGGGSVAWPEDPRKPQRWAGGGAGSLVATGVRRGQNPGTFMGFQGTLASSLPNTPYPPSNPISKHIP